ncbi:MAG: DMT family transporter, partial [Eubacteriales bacterium]
GHILAVDHYSPKVSGVALSCLQFLVAGLLSSVMMFLFESPSVPDLLASALPLLYVGVLSSGVAYTLQIMGQRLTTPAVASLIMSGEAIFALVGGMLILGERMTGREALGSALMFIAIIGAQLAQIPKKEKKLETV